MTTECHNLATDINGETRFAYVGQSPWHRLGTKVEKGLSVREMMEISKTDFTVGLTRLIAADEAGLPITNDDDSFVYFDISRGTMATESDGTMFGLATVGTRYRTADNQHNVEKALQIVKASDNPDVHIETIGALDEGRKFFVSIELGDEVVFERDGNKDNVKRYLGLHSSHDGTVPSTFGLTGIRMVCQNTVNSAMGSATAKFKARHTENGVDFDVEQARSILGMSDIWIQGVRDTAAKMGAINITQKEVDRIFSEMFPITKSAGKKAIENNDKIRTQINAVYLNNRNAGQFGTNGWSLWNSYVEFFDHHRVGTAEERAITSITAGSWVDKAKEKCQERVLALA